MTTTPHDRTLELLPWFLNGTLDAAERREVEAHLASCDACREELAATRRAFEIYAAHLPVEALTAYVLAPDAPAWEVDGVAVERRRLESHLAQCAACRDELALLREGHSAVDEAVPERVAEAASVVPFAAPRAGAPAAVATPRWLPMALAASLLFVVVTGAGWLSTRQQVGEEQRSVARLEQQLDEARAARQAAAAASPDGAAADPRKVDALESTVAELEARLGEMRGELERESGKVEELRAAYDAAVSAPYGASPVIATPFLDLVERGEGDEVVAVPGSALVFKILVKDSDLPFRAAPRYRVVDGSGKRLQAGSLELRPARDAFDQAYLPVALRTAGLASGVYVLEVLDGDEVVGRYPFRIP